MSVQSPKLNMEEDDLYSGYNDYHSAFETKDLDQDQYLQEALRTSYGKRPGVYTGRKTPGTALRMGTGYREGTASIFRPVTASKENKVRPMSAVKGAGYTPQSTKNSFDPLNQGKRIPTFNIPGFEDIEDRPEDKIKKMEKSVMDLIDESCIAKSKKDFSLALEKAKEASTKEKTLIKIQEQNGLADTHNLDLTFLVLFNLAIQYTFNEMYNEALSTYSIITRNRMFHNSNQLKINMANIYVTLGQIPKAIKMYRMTLDQVPNTHKNLRVKIMNNIGILFMKMGQYHEACNSFEYIMKEKADFVTGLHVILCYYLLGDKDKMKQGFRNMLEIPLKINEDKYNLTDDPINNSLIEVIRNDQLRQLEREMKQQAEHCILNAAKLIAPAIEINFSSGYNWCIETVRMSFHESLAGDLEINKAVMYMKQKELNLALETLKVLEKRDSKLTSVASTNLSFIYFLQGEYNEAEKYAEQARNADVYNAAAYVNLANCSYVRGDIEKAKQLYQLALDNEPSCVEALYNLGLIYKRSEQYEDALDCFLKLQTVVNNYPSVLYQLAHVYQLIGDIDQAIEWYLQLMTIVPADPSILQRLGEIYDSDNDKQQAYHYYYEAYRYLPSKLELLDWLGAYYVTHRVAEKAIPYYEKAALMQPSEPKWPLLIGSCHRRSGNYQQALQIYKQAHIKFPENIECLKFLIRLCSDLGLKEANEYALELKKVEKARELRERISSSRSGSRRSSGRSSRGGATPTGDSPLPQSVLRRGSSNDFDRLTTPQIDFHYSDPLGPLEERPRTGMVPPSTAYRPEEDFADEAIDQLLPE